MIGLVSSFNYSGINTTPTEKQMTEQNSTPGQDAPPESQAANQNPPPPRDWREQRHEERLKRHEERLQRREERRQRYGGRQSAWFFGAILIVIGVILLLDSLGYKTNLNWWALLILIPTYWTYIAAWNSYQDAGRMTSGAVATLAVAVLLTILTIIFLFNLELGMFWPFLIIIAGLFLIITALFPRRA
jgi:cation transport ATPase